MKSRINLLFILVIIILIVSVVLPGCASEDSAQVSPINSPPASPFLNPELFRSDQFHLTVQSPQGWTVAEGPESLVRSKIKGYAAFNSWGQKGFWAREMSVDNGVALNPQTIISQVPAGGAYVALVENVTLAAPPGNEPSEYALNDLSGLITPHDWRQDASAQAKIVSFFKWGRLLGFHIVCRTDASDDTVTALNSLLQSWEFDEILAGDPGWAFTIARQLLPAQVGPEKFSRRGGTGWDHAAAAVRTTQIEVRPDKTVHFRFTYYWNWPDGLTPGPSTTLSHTYHWWEIDVLPSGEAVFSAQGGTPLPTPNVPSTSPTSSINLVFKYGVEAKNELNTFAGTFTKDMTVDPSITVQLSLTPEEMIRIMQKMEEINFFEYPDNFFVKVPSGSPTTMVTPHSSYYFKVQYKSGIKELQWDDKIKNPDAQASNLRELIQLIKNIIESKDEYKSLPTPRGGYA